jgi:hypothetical protein
MVEISLLSDDILLDRALDFVDYFSVGSSWLQRRSHCDIM